MSTWGPAAFYKVSKIPCQTSDRDQETPGSLRQLQIPLLMHTHRGLNGQETLKIHTKSGETHMHLWRGGRRAKVGSMCALATWV